MRFRTKTRQFAGAGKVMGPKNDKLCEQLERLLRLLIHTKSFVLEYRRDDYFSLHRVFIPISEQCDRSSHLYPNILIHLNLAWLLRISAARS
ncbi:hypothetical protein BDR04DRAFT_299085 [Suillus decipiens]|nr:hypothetical protein BDR04DRAFT_299085 [Suillus decipiens]